MSEQVLIVDDEWDLVVCMARVLTQSGYEVLTANNGEMALELLKKNEPALMIIDLTMPVLNGWQLCMKVRNDSRFKETPIIVLSGLIESDREPEAFEPASVYMVKPFDIFKLVEKVKELLKASQKTSR